MTNGNNRYTVLSTSTSTQYNETEQRFMSVKTHRVRLDDYGDIVEIDVIGTDPAEFMQAVQRELDYRDAIEPR